MISFCDKILKKFHLTIVLLLFYFLRLFKVPQSKETYIEIKPDRGMYFPASETLRDIAIKHQDKKHPIVVNCSNFTEIDYTSLQACKILLAYLILKYIYLNLLIPLLLSIFIYLD